MGKKSIRNRSHNDFGYFVIVYHTIKPPAMRVVPSPALALDYKTSRVIIEWVLNRAKITEEVS